MTDYTYIIFILIIIVLVIIEQSKQYGDKPFIVAAILTLCFVGLRAPVVGADTRGYVENFLRGGNYNDYQEPLYNLYAIGLGNIWRNSTFFLFSNAFLSLIMLFVLIRKYSDYKVLSLFLFFCFNTYVNYFVASRQVLAISIFMVGMLCVLSDVKRKWLIYIACSIAAYFMHNSTIFVFIVSTTFYLVPLKRREVAIISIIVATIAGLYISISDYAIFFQRLNNLISLLMTERQLAFLDESSFSSEGLSGLKIISYLKWSFIGVLYFMYVDKKKLNDWFVKLFLFFVIAYYLFSSIGMIFRFMLFFQVASCIIIPSVINSLNVLKSKIPKFAFIIIIIYFLRMYALLHINYDPYDLAEMHPYYFFFEEYPGSAGFN